MDFDTEWLVKIKNKDGGWLCPQWKAHIKDMHGCLYGTIYPLEDFREVPIKFDKSKWNTQLTGE